MPPILYLEIFLPNLVQSLHSIMCVHVYVVHFVFRYTTDIIRKAPGNESAWNYLEG